MEQKLLKQMRELKAKNNGYYNGYLCLFCSGDVYKTFQEDAVRLSGLIPEPLKEGENATLVCEFYHDKLDEYLRALVGCLGIRIVVCDDEMRPPKKLVKQSATEQLNK